MRAPPERCTPMTGSPKRPARSRIRQIESAWVSPSEPPRTVGSCSYQNTRRPLIRPSPIVTPSPAEPSGIVADRTCVRIGTKLSGSSSLSKTVVSGRASARDMLSSALGSRCSLEEETGVVPAEPNRVRQHVLDLGGAGGVRDVVQIALRIRGLIVDRRRQRLGHHRLNA